MPRASIRPTPLASLSALMCTWNQPCTMHVESARVHCALCTWKQTPLCSVHVDTDTTVRCARGHRHHCALCTWTQTPLCTVRVQSAKRKFEGWCLAPREGSVIVLRTAHGGGCRSEWRAGGGKWDGASWENASPATLSNSFRSGPPSSSPYLLLFDSHSSTLFSNLSRGSCSTLSSTLSSSARVLSNSVARTVAHTIRKHDTYTQIHHYACTLHVHTIRTHYSCTLCAHNMLTYSTYVVKRKRREEPPRAGGVQSDSSAAPAFKREHEAILRPR